MEVEADSFWCLTKVLDGIQDNYTFAQPGIQLKVKQLEELIQRVDKELHDHLVRHEVLYLQFAFRWMNNLVSVFYCPLYCSRENHALAHLPDDLILQMLCMITNSVMIITPSMMKFVSAVDA